MAERIKPSDPQFKDMESLMYFLNILKNPQLFFDGERLTGHLPELETIVAEEDIKNDIWEIIDA